MAYYIWSKREKTQITYLLHTHVTKSIFLSKIHFITVTRSGNCELKVPIALKPRTINQSPKQSFCIKSCQGNTDWLLLPQKCTQGSAPISLSSLCRKRRGRRQHLPPSLLSSFPRITEMAATSATPRESRESMDFTIWCPDAQMKVRLS